MSDDRSPAVRAIDELLEKHRSKAEIAPNKFVGRALIAGIESGLEAARDAVIAAEREAADADARKRKEAIAEMNAEARRLNLP